MRSHLFTVTRADRPFAVVLACDFADAITIASKLATRRPRPANDELALASFITDLRARRPTISEHIRFAVAASQLQGELQLAALPL